MAAGPRTCEGAGTDVGFYAMGRRDDTATGVALHNVVWLEMGFCRLCSIGAGMVRRISLLVQERSGSTSLCERRRKSNAAGIARAYHSPRRTTTLDLPAADEKSSDARAAVFLLLLCVVLLHHVAADVFARRPWTDSSPRGSSFGTASFVRRIRLAGYRACSCAAVTASYRIFWISRNGHPAAYVDAHSRGGSGHADHGTRKLLQRSDDADFVGRLRGDRWP